MALTRKEKLLKAMLEDNLTGCGGGVTREERMLASVAKKSCENDVLEGGNGGGGSGSGGGNVFVVALDYTEEHETSVNGYTCDKTWSEIQEAHASGAAMFARTPVNYNPDLDGLDGVVAPLSYFDEDTAYFCGIYIGKDPFNPNAYVYSAYVKADGSVWLGYNSLTGVQTPT